MNTEKKSAHPSQPSERSKTKRTKSENIIHRFFRNFKTLPEKEKAATMAGLICFASIVVLILLGITAAVVTHFNEDDSTETPPFIYEVPQIEETDPAPIFADSEGTEIDLEAMTNAWAAEAGFQKRYELTDAERWEVASVVTSEATGEPFAGMVAVAQCILQAAEDEGIRPPEVFTAYKYTKHRPEPSEEALEAVQAVFDFGHVATDEPIKYFYNPAIARSEWHESQEHVLTINNHRFFKEATK